MYLVFYLPNPSISNPFEKKIYGGLRFFNKGGGRKRNKKKEEKKVTGITAPYNHILKLERTLKNILPIQLAQFSFQFPHFIDEKNLYPERIGHLMKL